MPAAHSFLHPGLYVGKTARRGRGVYCRTALKKDTLIETAPVIVMTGEERRQLDATLLHDYIFEWGHDGKSCCMALGYVPIYNHASPSNCEYGMDFDRAIIHVHAMEDIPAGTELTINYNGDYDDTKGVWFPTED